MKQSNYKKIREWLDPLAVACVIAAVMFFICWPLSLGGASMEETFHDGDRVFMSRIIKYIGTISYGDIVVCRIFDDNKYNNVVKRVIGVPYDHIVISGGNLYINDMQFYEPYVVDNYTSGEIDITLGETEYFIMGDSRWISKDSRQFGAVDFEQILGKVFFRFFPFDRMGTI